LGCIFNTSKEYKDKTKNKYKGEKNMGNFLKKAFNDMKTSAKA